MGFFSRRGTTAHPGRTSIDAETAINTAANSGPSSMSKLKSHASSSTTTSTTLTTSASRKCQKSSKSSKSVHGTGLNREDIHKREQKNKYDKYDQHLIDSWCQANAGHYHGSTSAMQGSGSPAVFWSWS